MIMSQDLPILDAVLVLCQIFSSVHGNAWV